MTTTCIIVTGGEAPWPGTREHLPPADVVIAADSGLDHAEALGLAVDLVVGDLDSVSKEALARARGGGIVVDEHPPAKDQTDLELALDAARARGAERIVVVSGGGGRLDHLLGGVLGLAGPATDATEVSAIVGSASVAAVRGPGTVTIAGRPGEIVTLLAVGGPAHGVRTVGLRYPLAAEALHPGSGRGISNELLATRAEVSLATGSLLVIRPDALEVAP